MNRLIDKTLNSLFKLAERLTGTQAQPTTTNSQPQKPQPPQRISWDIIEKKGLSFRQALRYQITTAVPLAATMSIEPLAPMVS